MKTNEVCDIHNFNYDLLNDLRWRYPWTGKFGRVAFYTKKKPTNNNPLFELRSFYDVIAIWKPMTNWDFRWQQCSGDLWYKGFLIDWLSFNCNFTEIRIPDGGSCLEWCVLTILLAENETSEYGQYLNSLRKVNKIDPFEFSTDTNRTTEKIRMHYAESLNYGYSPNIDELMNVHTEDEPTDNDLYCSSVL